jgi:hypothetical protein
LLLLKNAQKNNNNNINKEKGEALDWNCF